jgi:hypothetical protein
MFEKMRGNRAITGISFDEMVIINPGEAGQGNRCRRASSFRLKL